LRAPERLGDILETQDAGIRQVPSSLVCEPYCFAVPLVKLGIV
jgi:hypothetical protein